MESNALIAGLLQFVGFVAFVVLHEYAHAWMANRCGDDTPRHQGRLTIDPMAHIDWLGTIIVPLIATLIGAAGGHSLLFGWGRPVQVNLNNFRKPWRDDILVSAAGPAMNLIIAVVILLGLRGLDFAGVNIADYTESTFELAWLSLFLCFFNLLPIPPLDGGHIMRRLIGMTDEQYAVVSRFSFMFLLLLMRVPAISMFVCFYTNCVMAMIAWPLGWNLNV